MKIRAMLSGVGVVVILGFAAVCAGAEKMPSVSYLLDRYTKALDSTSSFIDHYEQTTDFSYRIAGLQDKGRNLKRGQFRHDDQRFYSQKYAWGDVNLRLKCLPEDEPKYRCTIVNGRDKTFYGNMKRLGSPDGPGVVDQQVLRSKDKVTLSKDFGVSYILGYVGSDERLDAVLRKADRISVRNRTVKVGGAECFVIDAGTKFGRYTVWLDPEHGFHAAKVKRRAKGGDYTHGRKINEGGYAKTYLDNVRFEKIGGIWVPMESDSGCDRMTPWGDFVKEDYHYKRTDIILNPDHDKLGSFADPISEDPNNDPELKDGTRVREPIPGAGYTWYKWQDGKLVPDVDKNKKAK